MAVATLFDNGNKTKEDTTGRRGEGLVVVSANKMKTASLATGPKKGFKA